MLQPASPFFCQHWAKYRGTQDFELLNPNSYPLVNAQESNFIAATNFVKVFIDVGTYLKWKEKITVIFGTVSFCP